MKTVPLYHKYVKMSREGQSATLLSSEKAVTTELGHLRGSVEQSHTVPLEMKQPGLEMDPAGSES